MRPLMRLSGASRWVVRQSRKRISSVGDLKGHVEITTPSSTPSYSTTIEVALVDESVDELILSIEVSGAEGHINLGASDEFLLESPLRLPPLIWPPSSLPLPPTPTLPFPSLIIDLVLPEIVNIEVSGTAIFLSFFCRTWHFDQALSI